MSATDTVLQADVPPPQADKPTARPTLRRKGPRSAALTGLFLLALVASLHYGREILLPMTLSFAFTLMLSPVVRVLHRCRIPEPIGAAIAVVGVVSLIVIGVMNLYAPALDWADRAPDTIREVGRRIRAIQSQVQDVGRAAAEVEKLTEMNKSDVPVVAVKGEDLQTTLARSTANTLITATVMIVLVYFLLATRARLLHKALALLVEPSQRPTKASIVTETERNLSRYLFTIAVKNSVLGMSVGLAMWAWGMPNPILWGFMAGVLNFVPYLGDLTGVTITAIVAFVTFNDLRWIGAPLTYLLLTNIEGMLVTPAILGRRFSLDPVVVFLWIIFWGWLWGIGGTLLAMPMLVTLRILSERSTALAPIALLISNRDVRSAP